MIAFAKHISFRNNAICFFSEAFFTKKHEIKPLQTINNEDDGSRTRDPWRDKPIL
jgi:hypothetical protein